MMFGSLKKKIPWTMIFNILSSWSIYIYIDESEVGEFITKAHGC